MCVLSHGNAAVERGFSINKECLVENLQQHSLVSQRIVYDAVIAAGGILNMNIDKSMILSVRNASAKRKDALQIQKQAEVEEAFKRKRVAEELVEVKAKKKKLIEQKNEEVKAVECRIIELKKSIVT